MFWRNNEHELALLCLEAGVERTYQAYVKAIRTGRSSGKLLDEEKARARNMARAHAVKIGKGIGCNVVRALREEFIDVWIARIIQRRKAGG